MVSGSNDNKSGKKPGVPDIKLGKRIAARRTEMRVSQAELAERLGVSFQQLQKYEKGVNRIGATRLYDIAEYLSVSMDYFFRDDPETSKG